MCVYCPCPGIELGIEPGAELEGGADGGGATFGAAAEETCPSIGANEEASKIAPITTRITG
jgi:hypothetical protein